MKLSGYRSERINSDWVTLQNGGEIEVIENDVNGRAKVTFASQSICLHIKHLDDQPPLKWASNRRCADAGIVVETGDGLCLHVVELKSRLTTKEWMKVKQQLNGMASNAIALLAVADCGRPSKVVSHVSYLKDEVGSPATADLVLLKMKVGESRPLVDTSDWHSGEMKLLDFEGVVVRKIPRDIASGEGFGDLSCPA